MSAYRLSITSDIVRNGYNHGDSFDRRFTNVEDMMAYLRSSPFASKDVSFVSGMMTRVDGNNFFTAAIYHEGKLLNAKNFFLEQQDRTLFGG